MSITYEMQRYPRPWRLPQIEEALDLRHEVVISVVSSPHTTRRRGVRLGMPFNDRGQFVYRSARGF